MSATAAIFYLKDGYNTSGQKLYGRPAASEELLKGLVNYGTSESPSTSYGQNNRAFSPGIHPNAATLRVL